MTYFNKKHNYYVYNVMQMQHIISKIELKSNFAISGTNDSP